jgi:hypothetical protein
LWGFFTAPRRGGAIEAIAHGEVSTSRVVGLIDDINCHRNIIGAVVRGNDVMIANDNLRIEQGTSGSCSDRQKFVRMSNACSSPAVLPLPTLSICLISPGVNPGDCRHLSQSPW